MDAARKPGYRSNFFFFAACRDISEEYGKQHSIVNVYLWAGDPCMISGGVARKTPIPAREKEIGGRLRKFRDDLRLSRVVVADELGIGVSRLASYEAGRVPVPYEAAKRLAGAFRLNYEWIVEGKGKPIDAIMIAPEVENSIEPRMLLSEAYDEFIKPALATEAGSVPSHFKAALENNPAAKRMVEFVRTIGTHKPQVREMLVSLIDVRLKQIPAHSAWPYYQAIAKASADFQADKNKLTGVSLKGKTENMKSEMQKLIEKVKSKASRPGGKSQLANELGVAPARVSEWLSGKKEPGGEYTLRLLKWVET
jgi:transcriptional regulator with XRE-family HTH domain